MAHDEHVLLLAICEEEPNSPARQSLYDQLRTLRDERAIAATFRDFGGRRGFLTSQDWQTAELTAAGRERLAAERAILDKRNVIH